MWAYMRTQNHSSKFMRITSCGQDVQCEFSRAADVCGGWPLTIAINDGWQTTGLNDFPDQLCLASKASRLQSAQYESRDTRIYDPLCKQNNNKVAVEMRSQEDASTVRFNGCKPQAPARAAITLRACCVLSVAGSGMHDSIFSQMASAASVGSMPVTSKGRTEPPRAT